jgi:hypothetical protein
MPVVGAWKAPAGLCRLIPGAVVIEDRSPRGTPTGPPPQDHDVGAPGRDRIPNAAAGPRNNVFRTAGPTDVDLPPAPSILIEDLSSHKESGRRPVPRGPLAPPPEKVFSGPRGAVGVGSGPLSAFMTGQQGPARQLEPVVTGVGRSVPMVTPRYCAWGSPSWESSQPSAWMIES